MDRRRFATIFFIRIEIELVALSVLLFAIWFVFRFWQFFLYYCLVPLCQAGCHFEWNTFFPFTNRFNLLQQQTLQHIVQTWFLIVWIFLSASKRQKMNMLCYLYICALPLVCRPSFTFFSSLFCFSLPHNPSHCRTIQLVAVLVVAVLVVVVTRTLLNSVLLLLFLLLFLLLTPSPLESKIFIRTV